MKISENQDGVLLLIDYKDLLISPPMNVTAEKPLDVTAISDGEMIFELCHRRLDLVVELKAMRRSLMLVADIDSAVSDLYM